MPKQEDSGSSFCKQAVVIFVASLLMVLCGVEIKNRNATGRSCKTTRVVGHPHNVLYDRINGVTLDSSESWQTERKTTGKTVTTVTTPNDLAEDSVSLSSLVE